MTKPVLFSTPSDFFLRFYHNLPPFLSTSTSGVTSLSHFPLIGSIISSFSCLSSLPPFLPQNLSANFITALVSVNRKIIPLPSIDRFAFAKIINDGLWCEVIAGNIFLVNIRMRDYVGLAFKINVKQRKVSLQRLLACFSSITITV